MTKVCHMSSVHEARDPRIFDKECVSLYKAGYEVYLVIPGESYAKDGIHVIGVEKPRSRLKRIFKTTIEVYKTARKLNCDIYHLHDPELLPYALLLKMIHKKVIYDSHENYFVLIKDKGYLAKSIRVTVAHMYRFMETFVCKRIDGVIYVGSETGKRIFDGRCCRSVAVENFPILNTEQRDMGEKMEDDWSNRNAICYIGNFEPSRAIDKMMKACRSVGLKLILGGLDVGDYFNSLKQMKEWDCVDFRGWANSNKKADIYKECFAGVVLIVEFSGNRIEDAEALPTKVYEYMHAGIPVIITQYQYSQKIIKENMCGLCISKEEGELERALEYLNTHKEVAKSMGENGKKLIRGRYCWSVAERELLNLYAIISNNRLRCNDNKKRYK